jgi:hypothetical protein
MAHLAEEVIPGPLRDWLALERQSLNGRFRLARQRFPKLDGEAFLALCREFLPVLAGNDAAESGELLHAAYDLLLLHAARGTLAPKAAGGGTLPGVRALFEEAFPPLRPLLLKRPRYLPGALSNAVENLAERGVELARGIVAIGPSIDQPDLLLDAGAVLAWRLGDARLRSASLKIAERLEGALFLKLLGLPNWPPAAAPLVLVSLATDGWQLPEELFSAATLSRLEGMSTEERATLLQATNGTKKQAARRVVGRLGNFRGFGGAFTEPPILLSPSPAPDRHRFWARSGGATYRIDADVFGWVCRPDTTDFPPSRPQGKRSSSLTPATTSVLTIDDLTAFTRSDSFRVRLVVSVCGPL